MDVLKIYAKYYDNLKDQMTNVKRFSYHIRIQFGLKKMCKNLKTSLGI